MTTMRFYEYIKPAAQATLLALGISIIVSCGDKPRAEFEPELEKFQIECVAFYQDLESTLASIHNQETIQAGVVSLASMTNRAYNLGEDWKWLNANDSGEPGTDEDANEWMGIMWALNGAQKEVDRLRLDPLLWPDVSDGLIPLSKGLPKHFFPRLE